MITSAMGGRGVRFDAECEERCDSVGGRANVGEKSPSAKSSTEGKIVRAINPLLSCALMDGVSYHE